MPSLPVICSLVVLAGVLVAVVRSDGSRPDVFWTGPAAAVVLATGLVSRSEAADTLHRLGPTLAFLAAMFVLAHLAEAAGLFAAAARALARAGLRGDGWLLVAVAVGAVVVTTVLSLDATAVLFTPVVVAATRGHRHRDGSLLATVFLANGASLLLPVANLTNLLALRQLDLTFPEFAVRMALPTLVAAVVITLGSRWLAPERAAEGSCATLSPPDAGDGPIDGGRANPVDTRLVGGGLVLLLVTFVAASVAGVEPAWVAVAGAILLAGLGLIRRTVTPGTVARSVDVAFLAFVATLAIVVAAPAQQGLTRFVADRLPDGTGLGALLAMAFGAALLANLLTNLPATLVLLPALADRSPALLLAALIGVNIGPNLTVTGSLATLLWRRVVRAADAEPPLRSFLRVGLATTPIALAGATTALWAALRLLGG